MEARWVVSHFGSLSKNNHFPRSYATHGQLGTFEHMMGTCAGLVGPKSEPVEKVWFFRAILKGSKMGRGRMSGSEGRVLGSF